MVTWAYSRKFSIDSIKWKNKVPEPVSKWIKNCFYNPLIIDYWHGIESVNEEKETRASIHKTKNWWERWEVSIGDPLYPFYCSNCVPNFNLILLLYNILYMPIVISMAPLWPIFFLLYKVGRIRLYNLWTIVKCIINYVLNNNNNLLWSGF